jgi:hypothetical protein
VKKDNSMGRYPGYTRGENEIPVFILIHAAPHNPREAGNKENKESNDKSAVTVASQ